MVQKVVQNIEFATGIPGEFYTNLHQRTVGKIINSTTESLNVIGVAVKQKTSSVDDEVAVDGTGALAGLLGMPKVVYRNTLDPVTFVSNGQQVEVLKAGYVVVNLPAAANIGDWVYYSDTTGVLETQAPGAVPSSGHSRLPGGTVQIKTVTEAGVGIIYFDLAGDATDPSSA
jgi:hypothetical protein